MNKAFPRLILVMVMSLLLVACNQNKVRTTNMFGDPGKSKNGVYTKGIEGKTPPSVQMNEDMDEHEQDAEKALKKYQKRKRKADRKRKRANRKRRIKLKKSKKKVQEEEEQQ